MIGKNQTAAAIAEWVRHVVPALQTCPLHHQNPENNPTPTRAPRSHPPIWDISQVLESDTKPQRHEVRPVRLSLRQTELSSSQGKPWKRAPERWKGRHTNPWFDHTWNIRPVWDPHTRWKDITRIEDVHRHFVIKKKIFFYQETNSVDNMLRILNWPCFEQQRKPTRLAVLYKITTGQVMVTVLALQQLTRGRGEHDRCNRQMTPALHPPPLSCVCQIWMKQRTIKSSEQDGIYAPGKVHMRSTPSLRSFPNVASEALPTFVWLMMALSRPFKDQTETETCRQCSDVQHPSHSTAMRDWNNLPAETVHAPWGATFVLKESSQTGVVI